MAEQQEDSAVERKVDHIDAAWEELGKDLFPSKNNGRKLSGSPASPFPELACARQSPHWRQQQLVRDLKAKQRNLADNATSRHVASAQGRSKPPSPGAPSPTPQGEEQEQERGTKTMPKRQYPSSESTRARQRARAGQVMLEPSPMDRAMSAGKREVHQDGHVSKGNAASRDDDGKYGHFQPLNVARADNEGKRSAQESSEPVKLGTAHEKLYQDWGKKEREGGAEHEDAKAETIDDEEEEVVHSPPRPKRLRPISGNRLNREVQADYEDVDSDFHEGSDDEITQILEDADHQADAGIKGMEEEMGTAAHEADIGRRLENLRARVGSDGTSSGKEAAKAYVGSLTDYVARARERTGHDTDVPAWEEGVWAEKEMDHRAAEPEERHMERRVGSDGELDFRSGAWIGKRRARTLASVMKRWQCTRLLMKGTWIDDRGLWVLARSLHSLQVIDFSDCGLTEHHAPPLGHLLERCHALEALALSGNARLRDAGTTAACNAILSSDAPLRELEMRDVGMTPRAVTVIAEIASGRSTLERIDVGWNNLSTKGANVLAEILSSAPALRELLAPSCRLHDEGVTAIASALSPGVDGQDNEMGELNDALVLKRLDLAENAAGEGAFLAMAEALSPEGERKQPWLKEVVLRSNVPGQRGIGTLLRALAKRIESSPSSLSVHIGGCKVKRISGENGLEGEPEDLEGLHKADLAQEEGRKLAEKLAQVWQSQGPSSWRCATLDGKRIDPRSHSFAKQRWPSQLQKSGTLTVDLRPKKLHTASGKSIPSPAGFRAVWHDLADLPKQDEEWLLAYAHCLTRSFSLSGEQATAVVSRLQPGPSRASFISSAAVRLSGAKSFFDLAKSVSEFDLESGLKKAGEDVLAALDERNVNLCGRYELNLHLRSEWLVAVILLTAAKRNNCSIRQCELDGLTFDPKTLAVISTTVPSTRMSGESLGQEWEDNLEEYVESQLPKSGILRMCVSQHAKVRLEPAPVRAAVNLAKAMALGLRPAAAKKEVLEGASGYEREQMYDQSALSGFFAAQQSSSYWQRLAEDYDEVSRKVWEAVGNETRPEGAAHAVPEQPNVDPGWLSEALTNAARKAAKQEPQGEAPPAKEALLKEGTRPSSAVAVLEGELSLERSSGASTRAKAGSLIGMWQLINDVPLPFTVRPVESGKKRSGQDCKVSRIDRRLAFSLLSASALVALSIGSTPQPVLDPTASSQESQSTGQAAAHKADRGAESQKKEQRREKGKGGRTGKASKKQKRQSASQPQQEAERSSESKHESKAFARDDLSAPQLPDNERMESIRLAFWRANCESERSPAGETLCSSNSESAMAYLVTSGQGYVEDSEGARVCVAKEGVLVVPASGFGLRAGAASPLEAFRVGTEDLEQAAENAEGDPIGWAVACAKHFTVCRAAKRAREGLPKSPKPAPSNAEPVQICRKLAGRISISGELVALILGSGVLPPGDPRRVDAVAALWPAIQPVKSTWLVLACLNDEELYLLRQAVGPNAAIDWSGPSGIYRFRLDKREDDDVLRRLIMLAFRSPREGSMVQMEVNGKAVHASSPFGMLAETRNSKGKDVKLFLHISRNAARQGHAKLIQAHVRGFLQRLRYARLREAKPENHPPGNHS